MVLRSLLKFSWKKLAVAAGFFASANYGIELMQALLSPAYAYTASGLISFLISATAVSVGAFVATGLFLQALKYIQTLEYFRSSKVWPLNFLNREMNFNPQDMWFDICETLRLFDLGLMRYLGNILHDNLYEQKIIKLPPKDAYNDEKDQDDNGSVMLRGLENAGIRKIFDWEYQPTLKSVIEDAFVKPLSQTSWYHLWQGRLPGFFETMGYAVKDQVDNLMRAPKPQ